MKLQYRYGETTAFLFTIQLYRDGLLEKSYRGYIDELNDEIEKIKNKGYVYGFTEEEVNRAKQRYEEMLKNVIKYEKKNNF